MEVVDVGVLFGELEVRIDMTPGELERGEAAALLLGDLDRKSVV